MPTTFKDMTTDGHIDFGLLDESFQKEIIIELCSKNNRRAELIELNPFLSEPGRVRSKENLITKNQAVILNRFNRARYRDRLLDVYEIVKKRPVEHEIDKKVLLKSFFDLRNFSMLKWSQYAD